MPLPLKVLHCIPSLEGGGAERQLALLSASQHWAGNEVHVAFIRAGPELSKLRGAGVVLHQIAASNNYDVRLLYRLASLIRELKPDIVQTWLPQMDVLAGLACISTRTPWVIAERCNRDAYQIRATDRILRPLIGRRADAVIANSSGGLEVWAGIVSERTPLRVIRNVLPLDAIRNASPATPDVLGMPADTKVVVFVGRLAPQKNIGVLADVAKEVVRRSSAMFLICGDGPLRPMLEERLNSFELNHRVKILGYQSNVTSLLKMADVLVSPSLFEGQPNAVLEAMACRCALVVSDIPAHREFLDGSMAALVPATDAVQMAAEAVAAMEGSDLTLSRIAACADRAEHWSPASAVPQYQRVYELAIERHGGPLTPSATR